MVAGCGAASCRNSATSDPNVTMPPGEIGNRDSSAWGWLIRPVKSSIAQSTAACAGPAFGGGPARRQPVPPQGAEALAFTGRRTMNTRGTRPGLSPTFYRWAEPSLTVQPLGTGRPLAISAVYRGPDFPRACSSSPDTDGVLQPRKSMTMLDLLAMEPAKAAPIPERNRLS